MMELWSKNLLLRSCPYKKDQVIFESSTQGTYNVEILGKGKYEVYCIGGGYFWKGSRAYSKAGGGSGGSTPEIICQSLLTAGNSGNKSLGATATPPDGGISVYGRYGAGARGASNAAGGNGYIKIIYKG